MSIPRKHHYVPQVHIKRFEHSNGYSIYLKNENKVISKKLPHDIFAVKDLNSSLDEEGNIDHISVEQTLGDQWDSKFNSHFYSLISWIVESFEQNDYSKTSIDESLKFFFEYGLIAYMRSTRKTPEFNKSTINSLLDFEELIPDLDTDKLELSETELSKEELEIGTTALKEFINQVTNLATDWQSKLKFPAPSATELPMLIPDNLICDFFISQDPPFYLPDCTAIILKSDETFEFQNQQINKIVSVAIPLTPSLFIQIRNKEFFPDEITDLYSIGKERTEEINNQLINRAFEQVLVSPEFQI